MGEWSATSGARLVTVGQAATTSTGTLATASATANTKGVWAQLVAATPVNASGIIVMLASPSAAGDYLIDVGLGAAGFESVLIGNILYCRRADITAAHFQFDIGLSANSRLVARVQSTSASATVAVAVALLSYGFPGLSHLGVVLDYGTATADSGGTGIDPGATLNTKNSWAELVAATARPIRWLLICIGNQGNNVRADDVGWLLNVGVGPAGQEHVLLANMDLASRSGSDLMQPLRLGPFRVAIPAGSRIAARAQCSISDATDRLFDVAVYGIS